MDRLKKEYRQTRMVISAHLNKTISLPTIKWTNTEKIEGFYDKLSNNFDDLQTLGKGDKLQGFVMNFLNKLPHVKPDLVRVESSWEEWKMETLISNLQAWLKRNKCEDGSNRKREMNWFGDDGNGQPKLKCIVCSGKHLSDECKTVVTQDQTKEVLCRQELMFQLWANWT